MPNRSKNSLLSNGIRLLVGVSFVGLVIYALLLGSRPTDWEGRARDALDTRDFTGAVAAATRCLEEQPDNLAALDIRARAFNALRLYQRALTDVEAALARKPNSPELVVFRSALLSSGALRQYEEAIAVVDEAARIRGAGPGIVLAAASQRLAYAEVLRRELVDFLEYRHPKRLQVREWLAGHYASPTSQSRERQLLLESLGSDQLAQGVATKLDRSWQLMHEADQLLGDPRQIDNSSLLAYLTRVELDLNFGRLLVAKQGIQPLLRRGLNQALWRRVLGLLVRILDRGGVYDAEARCLTQLADLSGGFDKVGLNEKANILEARFRAAEDDPSLRGPYLQAADEHLRKFGTRDMRSLGYRGVAELEWRDDPERAARAIDLLDPVFEALRMDRGKDQSILEPERARRFMVALLEAYLRAGRLGRGLDVADGLIELAPQDADLLRQRARILRAQGQGKRAADDLLRALRHSNRDPELFQEWLDTASSVGDATGRSPLQIAHEAANRWRQRKQDWLSQIGDQSNRFRPAKFRQGAQRVNAAPKDIGAMSRRNADDPLIAWLMAEEFGRHGETLESRGFLFQAAAIEPSVLEFRYRLGLYRLDLGLYELAAEEFERILDRDPTDVEAALNAAKCREFAGDLERARRIRQEIISADPVSAGLQVCVQTAIASGNGMRAAGMLAPYHAAPRGEIQALVGENALALGYTQRAIDALLLALRTHPESPEILRNLVLAEALAGLTHQAAEHAEQFIRLPRLLPSAEIVALLTRLEDSDHHHLAALVANGAADRYQDPVAIELKARGALDAFLAGDPELLRQLRDQPELGPRLGNHVVRAAFGLTLREDGPHEAAQYLQQVREYTDQRDWASLPTAAAFALTPFRIDVATFFGRYNRAHEAVEVPLTDAPMWWAVLGRVPKRPEQPPLLARGSDAEMLWLAQNASALRVGSKPLDELYLYFQLYDFAGPGFEADAHSYASRIMALDHRAMTAARYIAQRIAAHDGTTEAARYLLDKYQSLPTDLPTYILLGRLLMDADTRGQVLQVFAANGRVRFPGRIEPLVFGASAALRTGNALVLTRLLDEALEREPANLEVLALYSRMVELTASESAGSKLAERLASHDIRDPELRAFLLRWLGTGPERRAIAIPTLTALVDADPTYYAGARFLMHHLDAEKRLAEIGALCDRVIATIPADPGAATAGQTFLAMAAHLRRLGLTDRTAALVDAALFADLSDARLRRLRVDLLVRAGRGAEAIDDLRLLCVLAPLDPEVLFEYGEILLETRTDRADVLIGLLPQLRIVAGDDPRYHALVARNSFRLDRLEQAADEFRLAVAGAPDDDRLRYLLGLTEFILERDGAAREAFESLPDDFIYAPDVARMIEQLEESARQ